jgi:hypothetical protein
MNKLKVVIEFLDGKERHFQQAHAAFPDPSGLYVIHCACGCRKHVAYPMSNIRSIEVTPPVPKPQPPIDISSVVPINKYVN